MAVRAVAVLSGRLYSQIRIYGFVRSNAHPNISVSGRTLHGGDKETSRIGVTCLAIMTCASALAIDPIMVSGFIAVGLGLVESVSVHFSSVDLDPQTSGTIILMEGVSDREERDDARPPESEFPVYRQDWDRDLGLYNITELPSIPADGDPGSEKLPFGVKIIREFCLDAANSHAMELWFDFAPNRANGKDLVDACWLFGRRKGRNA